MDVNNNTGIAATCSLGFPDKALAKIAKSLEWSSSSDDSDDDDIGNSILSHGFLQNSSARPETRHRVPGLLLSVGEQDHVHRRLTRQIEQNLEDSLAMLDLLADFEADLEAGLEEDLEEDLEAGHRAATPPAPS